MPWNFLQIVEFGADSDGLFPTPTGSGIGFETGPLDANVITEQIVGLKVIRQAENGPWSPTLNVLRTNGKLVVSDQRLVVSFDKFVPKDQSSFQPVTLRSNHGTNGNGGRNGKNGRNGRRPKQRLVGHLRMTQLRQVGVRGASDGHGSGPRGITNHNVPNDGLGSLIISTTDQTDPGSGYGDHVAIEIILARHTDVAMVGNDVYGRGALARLRDEMFSIDRNTEARWHHEIRSGFSPSPSVFVDKLLTPYQAVFVDRSVSRVDQALGAATSPYLTPPTDTSPVPTMLPTPAAAMPAVGREGPDDDLRSADWPRTDPTPDPPAGHTVDPITDSLVAAPPPPGTFSEWRPDPFGRHELRYWDGFGWTEHVHSGSVQTTDPPR